MLSSLYFVVYYLPLVKSVEWIEHRGLWYYLSDGETVDYREATQICDSMNAHLAVITNEDQNDFLKNESSNNIERWIGLSTNSSHHNDRQCSNNTWFWNSDWNCTNIFEPAESDIYATLPVTYITTECTGITTWSGMWAMQGCSQKFEYVCQWECKRFYLNLNYDAGKLNGIYNFDSYYNGIARYSKFGTNRQTRIYKSETYTWILHNEDEASNPRARFFTESYVPYGQELSWQSVNGAPVTSSSWCVECEQLFMCTSRTIGNIQHCNFMSLNMAIPDYSNLNGTVFIKHLHSSDSCICMPTKVSCGQRCGHIFPYPEIRTSITFHNGETVVFINMCMLPNYTVPTTEISDVVTSMHVHYETTSLPDKLTTIAISVEDKKSETETSNSPNAVNTGHSSKLLSILAPVVSVVVVIIIVVVVVIVILLRKRGLGNEKSKSHSQVMQNTKTHVGKTNSNVYIDSDDPLQVNTLEHTYAEPAGYGSSHDQYEAEDHYTYVDTTNKNIISNSTKNYKEIQPSNIYAKEKPMDGYLAPDYGILMDSITKQDTFKPKQLTLAPPIYTEVKKPNPNQQVSEQDNADKLPMNRSEINDSGNENTYDTHNIYDEDNSNSHEYYNFEKRVDGDDDLELFENTVYNET